jgi:hypothetical protein
MVNQGDATLLAVGAHDLRRQLIVIGIKWNRNRWSSIYLTIHTPSLLYSGWILPLFPMALLSGHRVEGFLWSTTIGRLAVPIERIQVIRFIAINYQPLGCIWFVVPAAEVTASAEVTVEVTKSAEVTKSTEDTAEDTPNPTRSWHSPTQSVAYNLIIILLFCYCIYII